MSEQNRDRLLLLPDDQALPDADEGLGLVAMPGGLAALKRVGEAMRAVPEAAPKKNDADTAKEDSAAERTALWRGLTAVALLCDTWEDGPILRTVAVTGGTSKFVRAALRSSGEEALHLAVLGRGSESRVLGLCDAWSFLKPAATREDLGDLLSDRVTWYDRELRTLSDPCEVLCDRDRRVLADRLALANSEEAVSFRRDLLEKEADLASACVSGDRAADWETAVKAVVGLAPELTDDLLTVRELRYREHSTGNALLDQIGLRPDDKTDW